MWVAGKLRLLALTICVLLVATETQWAVASGAADVGEELPFELPAEFADELYEGGEAVTDGEDGGQQSALKQMPFVEPARVGLNFAETFDDDWLSRWVVSAVEKFSGEWQRALRNEETLVGDYGLKVMNEAKHHGVAVSMAPITSKDSELYVSYEAKFERGLNCGGAYMKLFDARGVDLLQFDNETPYVIMFGPDRCGSTNRVHVIIKQKNPISGEWTEHHLKQPVHVPSDRDTHLYALRILPTNEYVVVLDGVEAKRGSMHEDFEPAFTPPTQIPDPTDNKPADWVDVHEIPDASAAKPSDWDEDAPQTIADDSDVMPEGWREDEERSIVDDTAEKPDGWNDEEDGEWVAPKMKNPNCTVGCGTWKAKMVPNPNYKGKWVRPMIPNPEYKGEWEPRNIPNPSYFVAENPHRLSDSSISGVGFELWTMDSEILFDNIILGNDWHAAEKFIAATFMVRKGLELAGKPQRAEDLSNSKESTFLMSVQRYAVEHPILSASTALLSAVMVIWLLYRVKCCVCRPSRPAADATAASSTEKEAGDEDSGAATTQLSGASGDEAVVATATEEKGAKPRKRGGRPAQAD